MATLLSLIFAILVSLLPIAPASWITQDRDGIWHAGFNSDDSEYE